MGRRASGRAGAANEGGPLRPPARRPPRNRVKATSAGSAEPVEGVDEAARRPPGRISGAAMPRYSRKYSRQVMAAGLQEFGRTGKPMGRPEAPSTLPQLTVEERRGRSLARALPPLLPAARAPRTILAQFGRKKVRSTAGGGMTRGGRRAAEGAGSADTGDREGCSGGWLCAWRPLRFYFTPRKGMLLWALIRVSILTPTADPRGRYPHIASTRKPSPWTTAQDTLPCCRNVKLIRTRCMC